MRIWVTGIGVVSPLARSAKETMDRLVRGERAIRPLSLFDPSAYRAQIAAEIPGLSGLDVAPRGAQQAFSRTDAMAVLAAREALAHAGLAPERDDVDLILGGSTAGMFETEDILADMSRNPDSIAPLERLLSHPLSSTADHVHLVAGPFRRVRTVCSACSSGANAILLAAAQIQNGAAERVLAGGADGLCRLTFAGFGALSALSPEPCRPFDKRRAGLNLGEGAAFLVIESERSARARGAEPIVELRGWAIGAESHHITNPESSGTMATSVMRRALREAGLSPDQIDYVNAHGTATPLNDAMESAAIERCFGVSTSRVAVSSSKGQIGHTLAAAGAIEAAIAAMVIERGVLPPTIGLEEIDPACAMLRHVTSAEEARVQAVMSNSFGFGGTDSVLVFTAKDAFAPRDRAPGRRVVVSGAGTVGPLGVRGAMESLVYLEPGSLPEPGAIAVSPSAYLDASRARRMDRGAKLTTMAIAAARTDAGLEELGEAIGAVSGAAFGAVDASTAFMRRVGDKGPRFASPADFPNLVPSSPVGHASIYLGLRGPVLAVSELEATALSAALVAIELISVGIGDGVFAGSTEEQSPLVERCLSPLCSGILERGPRSEGSCAVFFESKEHAEARDARVLAVVSDARMFRGEPEAPLADLKAPEPGSKVFTGREGELLRRVLLGSAWQGAPMVSCADRAGDHEGASGFALAAAAAAVAAGDVPSALVLGVAPDRTFVVLLESARASDDR